MCKWFHTRWLRCTVFSLAVKSAEKHTVSSFETKWVVLSKAVKEVMFVIQLLRNMKISVKLPVTVRVDNEGTIFMSRNITTK